MENYQQQQSVFSDAQAAAAPQEYEQKSAAAPTSQETKNDSLTDGQRALLQEKLEILYFQQAIIGNSNVIAAVKTLLSIIVIKKKLKQTCQNEIVSITCLTQTRGEEYIKFGLEALYALREITTDEEILDKNAILSGIGSAEIHAQNYDVAEIVLDEAIRYENEHKTDETGLHISGLYRMRSKIFEVRGQHEQYVQENKLSVEILTNVKPELKSDFHDKYIAQIIPMYVEVEMEILKSYDHDETEKQLRRANDLWKKREGYNAKDYCHFKNTYLLLLLLSKSNDPSKYQEILDEVLINTFILKPLIQQSNQYMMTYLKSLILIQTLLVKEKMNKDSQNGQEDDEVEVVENKEVEDENEEVEDGENEEDDFENEDQQILENYGIKEENQLQSQQNKIENIKNQDEQILSNEEDIKKQQKKEQEEQMIYEIELNLQQFSLN